MINSSCIPDYGYFDSVDFLSTALHSTTIISTPINVFGLYFILFKTPRHMRSVKWYLVNLHTWIVLFDYSLGLFTVPIILLPTFAGHPFGILTYFRVPSLFQAILVLVLLGYVIVSIVAVFENRFHILCNHSLKQNWESFRKFFILFQYIGIIAIDVSFGYLTPNQDIAVPQVLRSLPCLPSYLYEVEIFVLADQNNYTYQLAALYIFAGVTTLEVIFFVSCITMSILKQIKAKKMSQKTIQMQKTFFIGLVVQMLPLLIMFAVPVIYALISIIWNISKQAYTNFCIIFASMHGLTSTLVMLFAHKPYREELLSFCFKRTEIKPKAVCSAIQL